MAIIYSYPKNTDILSTDIVLGTSTKIVNGRRKNITKNFEIGSIATFFNENSSIAIAGQNNFFFQNNIAPGRKAGSISFVPGNGTGTLFNNIVLLRISKFATSGKDVSAYIGTLIDQAIIIAQTDNLNNFGIYKCNDILPVAGNPNFLDLELEAVNANGAIIEDFFYAVAVYPGFINPNIDPGSNYTFTSPLINTSGVVSISQSSNISNGYLSSTDWSIFNSKQDALLGTGLVKSVAGTISYITDNSINWDTAYNDRITSLTTTGTGAATLIGNVLNIPTPSSATFVSLTTTGDSGSSTLVSGVLNVPTYTLAGLGGVPSSRTLTINGTAYDLTADRTWSVGTITGVTATGPITSSGGSAPIISTSIATNKLVGRSTAGTGVMEEITIGTGLSLSAGTLSSTNSGTVTSVGLTMPTAFTVSNSPITGAGTIAVTGAGTASQYIRGDGALATYNPGGGGGGSSVSYYLNGSISQGTIGGVAYKEMNMVPVIGTGTDFTINANGYIAQFITDAGDPNKLLIPAGNWNFETYFSASSGGGSPSFYVELYKYSSGGVFTLIASSSAAPEGITNGTAIDVYFTPLAVPATTLLVTDRLAVRFYVTHSGRTITMHTENSHLCQIITTFSTGLTALNGLTAQVQNFAPGTAGTDFNISSVTDTHTFNLPTASAINRGALSTTDWTTFNNKQNALTNPITGTGSGSTNVIPKFTGNTTLGNSQIFDNGTSVLIGTSTPPASGVKFLIYEPSTPTIVAYFQNNNATCYTGYQSSTTTLNAVRIGVSGNNLLFSVSTDGSPSERMRIDSLGNVGIGTSSPGVRFVNSGGAFSSGPTLGSGVIGSQALLSNNGLYGMYSGVSSNGDVWHQVQRNDANATVYNLALQPSGGNIYIGTNAPVYGTSAKMQFLFNGLSEFGMNFKSTAVNSIPIHFTSSTGTQTGYIFQDATSVFLVSVSDYRLKEDLNSFSGLDLISKINVYDYKWKNQDKRSFGVMAHELQGVVPQAAFGEKDGERMQGVDYSTLVPILIQAIKEQQTQIEELKILINK